MKFEDLSSFESGDIDDMDNNSWISFIDEYHNADYWYSQDEYDPNDDPCCGYDECDDDDDDFDDEDYQTAVSGAD